MKRSAMLRRTPMKRVGARGWRDQQILARSRVVVRKRCKGRCERCKERRKWDLHHRIPRGRGGNHEPENLSALCRKCHDRVHQRKGDWRKWLLTSRG